MLNKKKITKIVNELNEYLIERDQLIRLTILAIYSKSHMFLIGERGVAKSLTVRLLGDIIEKAKYWELQVGIDTEPRQLFGEKKVAENGTIYYEAKNTVLDSNIVFLDEMFKAKNEVLNMLLQLMVDRYYTTGDGRMIKVPLISLFGASNEYPTGEIAEPYLDRLLFWYRVERIKDPKNRQKYFNFQFKTDKIKEKYITIDEIDEVYNKAQNETVVPDDIMQILMNIIDTLLNQGVKTSDRKYLAIVKVMKISAYLNDRKEVDFSDLFLLLFTAWHNDIERRKVEDTIYYELFKNSAYFEGEIESIKKQFEKVSNIINGELYDFFNYNINFTGDSATEMFQQYYNVALQGISEYKKLYAKYEKNQNLINSIYYIEKLISENIFLTDIRNRSITEKILEELSKIETDIRNQHGIVYKFATDNKTIANYNKNAKSS